MAAERRAAGGCRRLRSSLPAALPAFGRRCICLLAVGSLARGAAAEVTERRLAVLPDVHGDLEALRGALRLAGVELPEGQEPPLLPGNTTLVSLGDLVDRGPDGPACYELLASLAEGGTSVRRLLGNHEWLNLLGVDRADDPSTPGVREDLLGAYVHAGELQTLGGWKGRRHAFSPKGELGSSIAASFELLALLPRPWRDPEPAGKAARLPPLDAAATLFLHGGISWASASRYATASDLAAEARAQLQQWARRGEPELLLPGREPPEGTELFDELLQDRTLAEGPEGSVCPELEAVLAHFGAARLVLGHTPQQRRRASVRCGGRLLLLDVAMSRWLVSMRRPESSPRPALLELRYTEAASPEGNDMLTSLRALYMPPGGGSPEEELLPPFDKEPRADL